MENRVNFNAHLKKKHKKYKCVKYTVFGFVCLTAVLNGVVSGLNKIYRLKNDSGFELSYTIIIGCCSLMSVFFYIGTIFLLNSAVKRLKRFADECKCGSDKLTACLHFSMIISLFVTTVLNDFLIAMAFFSYAI